MTLKQSCAILGIEVPNQILSNAEKSSLLNEVRKKYRDLLKNEHPDVSRHAQAHNRTIGLNEAFKSVKAWLLKRHFTITEYFAIQQDRSKARSKAFFESRKSKTGQAHGNAKTVLQFSMNNELLRQWPSIKKAGRTTGIDPSLISKSMSRYRGHKTAGGFIWKLAALFMCMACQAASIQLSWNANPPAENVTGYRVYSALGTAVFSLATTVSVPSVLMPVSTNAISRYFVTALNSAGESGPSNTITNIPAIQPPPPPPATGLTFEAEGGIITAPFYIGGSGTYIQQDTQSGLTDGGRAAYIFSATNAGDYTVTLLVNAPGESANSIYLSIDAEPTDPMTIWDIPVTDGITSRVAAWRGAGTFDNNQFVPKVFTLTAGKHTLNIRGREAGVQIDRIEIKPTSVIPPPPPPPVVPNAPQNLRATVISTSRIDIRFDMDAPASVNIEQSRDGVSFAQIATLAPGILSARATGLKRRTQYWFRGKSFNSAGQSAYSGVASARTL